MVTASTSDSAVAAASIQKSRKGPRIATTQRNNIITTTCNGVTTFGWKRQKNNIITQNIHGIVSFGWSKWVNGTLKSDNDFATHGKAKEAMESYCASMIATTDK